MRVRRQNVGRQMSAVMRQSNRRSNRDNPNRLTDEQLLRSAARSAEDQQKKVEKVRSSEQTMRETPSLH
jgi:hypothetical protein